MVIRCLPLGSFRRIGGLLRPSHFRQTSERTLSKMDKDFIVEPLGRHLEFLSREPLVFEKKTDGTPPLVKLKYPEEVKGKPLAVLFEWISAEKKVFYKYAGLYLERGFDVLAVSLSVKNLLWPASGSQVIASEALQFLYENTLFEPLVVHGFSIGGYLWGEVLVLMEEDLTKYQRVLDRIKGQVWDSTPDVNGFYKGFPRALFPNNSVFRFAVEKSIAYHLHIFHNSSTRHYNRSSQSFHNTPVTAPALFFIAKNDLVASYETIVKLKEYWESLGRKVYLKSWENSKHVSHLRLHEKDYIQTLDHFLSTLDLKNQAKNHTETEKIHSKL